MPRRDSNTGGSDLWSSTLPLDHGGAQSDLGDQSRPFCTRNRDDHLPALLMLSEKAKMVDDDSTKRSGQKPSFTELNDLISSKIGGKVIFSTDDWFATAENLIKAEEAVFEPASFTDFGKWMDGWETRRKRIPGHDWCIIQLGAAGIIHGVDIDTSHFTGNYAPKVSIQAANIYQDLPARRGDRMGQGQNMEERKMIDKLKSEVIDLAAMLNGGICLAYSNAHFGHPKNMIGPGRSKFMRDGWETARRLDRPAVLQADANGILQVPGSEWAVFKLGHPGVITKVEIDTNHFKGNFPDSCWIEVCRSDDPSFDVPRTGWKTLLPAKKLSAHNIHYFTGNQLRSSGTVTHARIFMAPDGGISRVRLWGNKQVNSVL
ncbi:hypothetical protein LSH36_198g04010 [Paralvinella palmiformis]|uniref:Allantoate amidinohydrolase n=1 Tax=Paralvinella palmiformis TaxID=53620 RepID=A0AAD9JR64_9ANNE|nr:hypothetical protein LSH36_198g04010 [Paralvinella palmiformis]